MLRKGRGGSNGTPRGVKLSFGVGDQRDQHGYNPAAHAGSRVSQFSPRSAELLALRLLDDLVRTQRVHDLFALRAGVAGDDEEVVGALSDRLPLSG